MGREQDSEPCTALQRELRTTQRYHDPLPKKLREGTHKSSQRSPLPRQPTHQGGRKHSAVSPQRSVQEHAEEGSVNALVVWAEHSLHGVGNLGKTQCMGSKGGKRGDIRTLKVGAG